MIGQRRTLVLLAGAFLGQSPSLLGGEPAVASAPAATITAAASDSARRLAGRAVGPSPLLSDLKELCDQIGGRPAGSDANKRAVEWGLAKFKAAGLENVATEGFTVSDLWLPGTAEARCVAPESFPIRLVAAPFSVSTPDGKAMEARVVDAHVNPMVPVRLSVEGGEIAVRFAHPRAGGALVRLDPASLARVSSESAVPAERPAMPSAEAVRAVFDDGRFIVCWKSGDGERGYRWMAQAWTGGGAAVGPAMPISPSAENVLGALQLTALDGDRAVATFAVMTGDRAELLAVSLDVL